MYDCRCVSSLSIHLQNLTLNYTPSSASLEFFSISIERAFPSASLAIFACWRRAGSCWEREVILVCGRSESEEDLQYQILLINFKLRRTSNHCLARVIALELAIPPPPRRFIRGFNALNHVTLGQTTQHGFVHFPIYLLVEAVNLTELNLSHVLSTSMQLYAHAHADLSSPLKLYILLLHFILTEKELFQEFNPEDMIGMVTSRCAGRALPARLHLSAHGIPWVNG